MKFIHLADHPNAITLVASWFFEAWGERTKGSSVVAIEQELTAALNRDRAPLFILAVENENILGVAGLKLREMDHYPDFEYWLGGVYVPECYRGRQLASQLANRIAEIAATLGITELYLQTDDLRGGLYAKLGWQALELVRAQDREVLVMRRDLDAHNPVIPMS